jgi:hypothetical protein
MRFVIPIRYPSFRRTKPCRGSIHFAAQVPDPRFSNVTETSTSAVSEYNGAVVFSNINSRWNGGLIQAGHLRPCL